LVPSTETVLATDSNPRIAVVVERINKLLTMQPPVKEFGLESAGAYTEAQI